VQAAGCEHARILLENGVEPDLVILEPTQSSSPSGFESILRASSNVSVCLLQSARDIKAKNQALAFGVRFFLESPLIESEVIAMLDQVSSPLSKEREALPIAEPYANSQEAGVILEELGDGRYFLAASPSMLKIYRQVQLLADVDAPVLILGESGTGKEVIAHLIHAHSRRAPHRFVNVNCAA